jgi:hypothetical protein
LLTSLREDVSLLLYYPLLPETFKSFLLNQA